jgi:hypothetical protein
LRGIKARRAGTAIVAVKGDAMGKTLQEAVDPKTAQRWSFGLLGAIVVALLLMFYYLGLPLIFPLD